VDFMKSVIKRDFDVELIYEQQSKAFFGAARPDYWHFVSWIYNEGKNDILQIYISRYYVAKEAAFLEDFCANISAEPNDKNSNSYSLHVRNSDCDYYLARDDVGRWHLCKEQGSFTPKGFPTILSDIIAEDIKRYKKAVSSLKKANDGWLLPRAKSFDGHPVVAESQSLIESIAFEKTLTGKLNARRFGIYSAYCTWRDRIVGTSVSMSLCRDLVEGQFEYDPEEISDRTVEIFMQVQQHLLSRPIWGSGLSVDIEEASNILHDGLSKLDSYQITQFHLLNGMHSGGLFYPLALILGVVSLQHYCDIFTEHCQPDSPDEQFVRSSAYFINMLGILTHEDCNN